MVSGLDQEQKKFIDLTIARALYLYSGQYEISGDFTPEELVEQTKVRKTLNPNIKKFDNYFQFDKYKLPVNFFESSIFIYNMGLNNIKNKRKLEETDFIDAGAFCGDSAMMLNNCLNPGNIYCFEPEAGCFKHLQKTISLNNLEAKFKPINEGLGDKRETKYITTFGAASSIMIAEAVPNAKKAQIKINTIDVFTEKNDLNIGLIKIDVEGFDLEVLKGAENTIRKFKPVIIGSIYHNAQQFFEFKPLLESWGLGYKFHFEKLNPEKFLNEISVLCEVY